MATSGRRRASAADTQEKSHPSEACTACLPWRLPGHSLAGGSFLRSSSSFMIRFEAMLPAACYCRAGWGAHKKDGAGKTLPPCCCSSRDTRSHRQTGLLRTYRVGGLGTGLLGTYHRKHPGLEPPCRAVQAYCRLSGSLWRSSSVQCFDMLAGSGFWGGGRCFASIASKRRQYQRRHQIRSLEYACACSFTLFSVPLTHTVTKAEPGCTTDSIGCDAACLGHHPPPVRQSMCVAVVL